MFLVHGRVPRPWKKIHDRRSTTGNFISLVFIHERPRLVPLNGARGGFFFTVRGGAVEFYALLHGNRRRPGAGARRETFKGMKSQNSCETFTEAAAGAQKGGARVRL